MSEFFNYDPITGVTEYFDYDNDTGDAKITFVEDIEPLLERAKMSRINGLRDHGIKESWFHYASIPPTYQMRLRKMGLDVGNPAHAERIIEHINTHWPELKFTEKNHGGRVKQYFT